MALTSANANTNQPISEFHQLVRNFGTTGQRPTLDLITGQTYFDTTLGSWIYWDGSTWITNSGSAFPVTGLVDGQRFWHTTYRSWFVYNLSDTKWRQEAPGVFASSFPTVAAGDNTVAPDIEVKRLDRSNTIYFWDGTRWLTTQLTYFSTTWIPGLVFPLTVTSSVVRADNPEAVSDIYLVQLTISTSTAATYNVSNFWTFQLFRIDNAGTATGVGAAQTTWQTGRVAATRYPNTFAINTQLTAANAAAFRIDLATSGAPGGITPNPPILAVRYVG